MLNNIAIVDFTELKLIQTAWMCFFRLDGEFLNANTLGTVLQVRRGKD